MEVIKQQILYSPGQEHLNYFSSDIHFGGEDFDKKSFTKYFDEAIGRGAQIWVIGDIVGGISPKDPRFTVLTQIESHKKDAWINVLVDELFELFRPYANHIAGLGIGNHEFSMIKFYGFNPIFPLIKRLNEIRDKTLEKIVYLDYCGFLWFTFKPEKNPKNGNWHRYQIFYHHGISGNAPVTEGIIGAKRLVEKCDGIDCLVLGHSHKNWSVRNERFFVNKNGGVEARPIRLINTGSHQRSYKSPGQQGNIQWSELKGFGPGPFGGAFLKIKTYSRGLDSRVEH